MKSKSKTNPLYCLGAGQGILLLLWYSENLLGGQTEDLRKLIVGQSERKDGIDLALRSPHRVIRPEHDMIRAILTDDRERGFF